MTRSTNLPFAAAFLALTGAGAAYAHVGLTPGAGLPGATVTASLAVSHGCSGQPTTALTLEIPATIAMVHAMDADGWSLKTDMIKGRVTAVTWTVLAPRRGEGVAKEGPVAFPLHLKLPATSGKVSFPVTQVCGKTQVRWDGQAADRPAPSIEVSVAPAAAAAPLAGNAGHTP